eukprot:6806886-Pyramimonas_sp.AAC.1
MGYEVVADSPGDRQWDSLNPMTITACTTESRVAPRRIRGERLKAVKTFRAQGVERRSGDGSTTARSSATELRARRGLAG